MARYYYIAGQLVTVQDKEEEDFKTLNPGAFPVRVFVTKEDNSISLIQDPELNDFLTLNKGRVYERKPMDLSVKPGKKIPGKPEPKAPPAPPTGDELLKVGIGPKLKRDAEEVLNPKPKPPKPKYELKAAPRKNDIREWGLDLIDKVKARLGGYKTKEELEERLVKIADTPEEAELKRAATTMPEQYKDTVMELFDWQTVPNKTPEQIKRVDELLDRKYYIEAHMEPFSAGMTPTQYQSKKWEQELSKNNTFIEKLISAASYGALSFLTGNKTALDPGGEMSNYLTYGFQGLMSTLDKDETGNLTPKGKAQAGLMSLAYSAPMTMTMMAAGAFSSGLTGITKAPALLKSVFSMVARGATLAQQEMMFAHILSQENKADYDAGRLTDTNFFINTLSAAAQAATESLSFSFQTGAVKAAFRKGGLGALREMARKDLLKAFTMTAGQFSKNALLSFGTESIEEGAQNIQHHLGNALKGDPLPALDVWIPEIARDMFWGGVGGWVSGNVLGVIDLAMNPTLVSRVQSLSRGGWQSATYALQSLEQIKAHDWDNFEASWQLAKEAYATEQPDSPHLARAMTLIEDAYRAQQSSDVMESDRTIHQAQIAQRAAQQQIKALERFKDANGNFSDPKHAEQYREAVREIREQQKIIDAETQVLEADDAKKAMYESALRAKVLEYRLQQLETIENPTAKEAKRRQILRDQVRAERAASMGERRFLRQMHLTPGEQSEIFTPQELEYIETGIFPDATHEGTTLYSSTPVEEGGIKSGKYSTNTPVSIEGEEATPGSKIVFNDDARVLYLDQKLSQMTKKQLKEAETKYDAVIGSDGEARIFNPDSVRSISEFTPQPAPAKTNTDRAHNRDLREANRQRVSEATHKLAAESILEMMKSHIKTTEHPDASTTRVTFNDGRTLEINTKTGLIEARNDKGEVIHHQDGTTALGVGQTYSVDDVKVVIELVEGYNGGNSTGFHEAFHAVWKLFLSSKQRAFVSRYYDAQGKAGKLVREISYGKDNKRVELYWTAEEYAKMSKEDKLYWQEEGAAYGFEQWLTKRMADKTTMLGRIWQKLADGIHGMMSRLGLIPKGTDITGLFRQIAGDKLRGTGTLGAKTKAGASPNTGISDRMYSRRTLWGTIDPAISRMLKQGKIGEATAKQYRQEAQQLEDIYKANPELEMVWAGLSLDYLDEAGVLRKNSDKTYKISADFGRECKKRIAFARTISNVQKEIGRFLRPFEYIQIREALKAAGEEVPCHICYVDAGRISLGLKMERWLINTPNVPADVRKMLLGYEFYQFEMKYPELYKKLNSYVAVQNTTLPTVFTDYGVKMGKKPAGEILRKQQATIDALNAKGGLRAQSWSDWMPWQIMDWYQILIDAKAQDLKIQTYAKVPEFVEVFGNSGIMFNLSLIYKRTEDGNFVPDDIEGINYEKAQSLRDRFPKTVGTVAVAMSHDHMLQLMADPKVDYIIPYHISGNVKEARQMMGIGDWQDFTSTQSEHVLDKEKFEDSQFNGDKGEFHEWFVRREWWDINKTGDQNAQTYLSMCDKCGLEPIFSEYKDVPGYWKTLIEHKMYDNSGKGIVQTAVSPNIDMKRAKELLKNYKHDRSDRMDIVRISKFYTSVGEEMLGEEWMKAIAPNQITEGELLTGQQEEYCKISALLVEDPEALTKKQASTLKSAITKMNQGVKAYLSVKIDGTPVNQLGKDKTKGYRFINGIVSGQTSEIGFLWEPLTEWVKNKVAESLNWKGRIESISDMVSRGKDNAMFKLAPTRTETAEAERQMEAVAKKKILELIPEWASLPAYWTDHMKDRFNELFHPVSVEEGYYDTTINIEVYSPLTKDIKIHTEQEEYEGVKLRPRITHYDSSVVDEAGNIIDDRYQPLRDHPILQDRTKSPDTIWRGISAPELSSIIKTGKIQSLGDMNFDTQQGKTYFSEYPEQPSNYATWFSGWYDQPTFERPSYVIELKRPSNAKNNEVGEVEIDGAIPASKITKVYELRLASEQPGRADMRVGKYGYDNIARVSGTTTANNKTYIAREIDKSEWQQRDNVRYKLVPSLAEVDSARRQMEAVRSEYAPGRKEIVQKAKELGLPATGTTESILRLVNITTSDPKQWSEDDFKAIMPYLSIHQDLRPGNSERVASIMERGLDKGMVDNLENLVTGRYWSWGRELQGSEAYVFLTGKLKFRSSENPYLSPGNIPLFHITTKKGQSAYEALQTATQSKAGTPAALGYKDTYLKAPNGKPSNLTERQWLQVRTPAFKAWFGDWENDPQNASKVVDRNGEPMVVRHASRAAEPFSEFDPEQINKDRVGNLGYGFYFTSGFPSGTFVIDAFLDIKKPAGAYSEQQDEIEQYAGEHGVIEAYQKYAGTYDGVIDYNSNWGIEYMVLSPTQIKSAISNVGTFSNGDADIRYKLLPKSETPKKTITVVRMGYLNKDGTVSPVQVDGKTTRDRFDWGTWYKAEGRKSAMVPRWGFHSGYPENGASFDQLYRNDGTLDPERVYYLAEVGIDKSYQDQVDKTKTKDIRYGIPEGGYYHFWNRGKKNPPWIITDTMKPIRVLSWEEVEDLNRKAGKETVRGYPKDKYDRLQGTGGSVADDTRFRLFSNAGRDYVRGNRFGIVSEEAVGETDKVHQVPVNVVEDPTDPPPKQEKKPTRISAQEVKDFAARMEEEHGFDKNEVIETVGRQLLTSMEHAHETIAGILTEAREATFPDEASARVPGYQEGESIHWSYQAMEEYADSMNMSVDEAVRWLMETRHDATAAGIKLFGRFKYVSDQLIEIYEQLETEDSQSKRAQLEKDLNMLISERDDLQVAMDRQSSMAGTILRTRGIQKQRMMQQLEREAERLQRSVEADSQEIAAIKKELAELDEMLTALEKEYAAWKAAQQPKEHLKSKPGPRGESEGQRLLRDIASIKSRMATLTHNLQEREQHKRADSSRSEEVKKQLEESKKKNGRARAADIKPKKLTLYDWWRIMFYNMILSGPPTHMINIGANLANSVFELAADNLSLPGIGLRGAGSALRGIPGGLKAAVETFKTPDDYAKKYEMGKSTNKFYNFLNINLRLLSAEDAYFFSTNYRASLKSLAVFEARRTKQSAQFLYENPTADMIKQATYEARKMSFNHNPEGFVGILVDGIEKGYSAMENHFGLSGKVFAGLLRANIMPFVRIVANVVNTNIDYTPGLGLVRLAMYASKKPNLAFEKQRGVWMNENRTARLSPYRVRDMRKQLARQAIGTILLSLLYALAKSREEKDPDSWLISGSGPRDKAQRDQLMSMGWRPNSINIGGRAIPYVELPVGAVMAMLGNYLDFEKYNQSSVPIDQYKSLGYSVMGIAKAFMGRTFLTGLQTTIVAINTENPDWLMKQAASTAVSPFNWGLARFFSNMYDRDSHQPEGLQWFLYQLPVPPPSSVAHGVTYYGTHAKQKHWLERFIGVPVAPAKDMPAGLADVVKDIRKAGNWVPVSGTPELRVGPDEYFTPRGRDLEIYKELRAGYLVELMLASAGTIQELSTLPTRPPLTKFLTKISTSATARAKNDLLEAYNTGQLIHKYKTYAKATKPLEMIDSSSLPVVEEPEEYEEENP